ncbi:MAG: protein kinase [Planctomycetaceae bacterium]|nr:protein kinase [Planctomycetaceae bacterium]
MTSNTGQDKQPSDETPRRRATDKGLSPDGPTNPNEMRSSEAAARAEDDVVQEAGSADRESAQHPIDGFSADKTVVLPPGFSSKGTENDPDPASQQPEPPSVNLDGTVVLFGNSADPASSAEKNRPAASGSPDSRTADDSPSEEQTDPFKTFVPKSHPTHHDFSFEAAAERARQEKTESASEDEHDPKKTFVPHKSPTVVPPPSASVDPIGSGTVILGGGNVTADHDDNVGHDTVVTDQIIDTDKTAVFEKSIGMRGLTEDEYDEWQKEVDEKLAHDTNPDGPNIGSTSDSGSRRTQIWSKQTGAGLDFTLTIRSRPVAGEDVFEDKFTEEKPDYEIVEKLAEGGMGAIYIARQTSLDREIAIKTLKPLTDRDQKAYETQGRISQVNRQRREMFLSEALVTANLVHPHIIPIHDLCQTNDGAPFYAMKRVHGTPWSESIGKMSLEDNLEVLYKVCDAVAYAHHNGVVNRDLKPENIMLGEFGEVLVLDWGLAVPASDADKKRFASPSASFGAGTPAYMSPELWAGPADMIGPWSDIYLLGGILFEVITGKAPHQFPEPDSSAGNSGLWMLIDKVVRQNVIRQTTISGELMDIAMKAMATRPKERYQTVLEFRDAVKRFQKHEESRRLTRRAEDTLNEGLSRSSNGGYQHFQTAAALFEEAFVEWPENSDAREGLRQTRQSYAELAWEKGDYDLGLQIASQETHPEFVELTRRLETARRRRSRLKSAATTAVAAVVILGLSAMVQGYRIRQQNQEITQLYGDKQSLESEKHSLISDRNELEQQKTTLLAEKTDLESTKLTLESEKEILEQQKEKLTGEKDSLLTQKQTLEADKGKLEQEIARVEQEKQVIAKEITALGEQKVRAQVDLQNAAISSLIRSADYAAALQRVDELLNDLSDQNTLQELPASERSERIAELQARRAQLLNRARQSEVPVQTQMIAPSGRFVVWGDSTGRLEIRTLINGQPEASATAQFQLDAAVTSLQISDDEQTIISASGNKLFLWNPAEQTSTVREHSGHPITSLAVCRDGILSGDAGGVIHFWDSQTLQSTWTLKTATEIRDLAVLPDEPVFLYAGSRGGESSDIMAYEFPAARSSDQRPRRIGQMQFPRNRIQPPNRMVISPDGNLLLLSNSRNGELLALPRRRTTEDKTEFPFEHPRDLADRGAANWAHERHQRPVNDIVFSADGHRLVTASEDRSVGVWQIRSDGSLTFEQRLEGHGAKVNAAGFLDSEGTRILSTSADRFSRVWDLSTYQKERRQIQEAFDVSLYDFNIHEQKTASDSGMRPRFILTGTRSSSRKPLLRNTAVGSETGVDHVVINADSAVQRGAVKAVNLSPDGTRLVTGAADGTAVIWDTSTGQPVEATIQKKARGESAAQTTVHHFPRFAFREHTVEPDTESVPTFDEGHDFNVSRLMFLPPTGNVLLTTGFDGNLCLWNANLQRSGAGAQELRLPGMGLVNALAVSSDGQWLVASVEAEAESQRGAAAVWKTSELLNGTSTSPVITLEGAHRGEVSAIAFSDDSTSIVTGARDGRVAVWSIDGRLQARDQIHVKNTIVSHLQWLPDGTILSAGFDGSLLRLTADRSSQKIEVRQRFEHERIPVEQITMSPDRKHFVSVTVRTDRRTKQTQYEMQLWNTDAESPLRQILPATIKNNRRKSESDTPKNTDAQPSHIGAIDWSPDGRRMAAVVDGNLQIFDTISWTITKVVSAPGLGITDAVFSIAPTDSTALDAGPAADIIATFDGTAAHLWDLQSGRHLADFRPLFSVQSTALSSALKQPILLTGDRAIRIFDADENSPQFSEPLSKITDPHRGIVTALNFHPTESKFVSAGADGSAAIWNWNGVSKEVSLDRWLLQKGEPIVNAVWRRNDLVIVSVDGTIQLMSTVDTNSPPIQFSIRSEQKESVILQCAAVSDDGQYLAVGGQIKETGQSVGWILKAPAATPLTVHCDIQGHDAGGIQAIDFLPGTSHVVTGGADGAAILWNWHRDEEPSESGKLLAYEVYTLLADGQRVAHPAPINAVSVSSSGRIATASDDGTAILWKNPFSADLPR